MQNSAETKSPYILELAVELYNQYSHSALTVRTKHLGGLEQTFSYHSAPFHVLEAAHLALSWKEEFGENAQFIH